MTCLIGFFPPLFEFFVVETAHRKHMASFVFSDHIARVEREEKTGNALNSELISTLEHNLKFE